MHRCCEPETSVMTPTFSMRAAVAPSPQVPAMYTCPLTTRPMKDPVILVESGAIFERRAIEAQLASGTHRCPHSHIMLPVSDEKAAVTLLPADDLRKVISFQKYKRTIHLWCICPGNCLRFNPA